MIAIYITNIIFGFVAVLTMLYVLKVNFEHKDDMLKLFQFGLIGVLVINLLTSLSLTCSYYSDKHIPTSSDKYNCIMNLVICFLIVPYFIFAKRKRKKI